MECTFEKLVIGNKHFYPHPFIYHLSMYLSDLWNYVILKMRNMTLMKTYFDEITLKFIFQTFILCIFTCVLGTTSVSSMVTHVVSPQCNKIRTLGLLSEDFEI